MRFHLRPQPVLLRLVRCTLLLVFLKLWATALLLAGTGYGQQTDAHVTVVLRDQLLEEAFGQIEQQTEYKFIYDADQLRRYPPLRLTFTNTPLAQVLDKLLEETNLTFQQINRQIIIRPKTSGNKASASGTVTGQVSDALSGEALAGVNVIVKGTAIGAVTNADGRYAINAPDENSVLVFSFIGYTPVELPVGNRTVLDVSLAPGSQTLQQVVVIGYGTQQRADVTGSVAQVKGRDFRDFPITSFEQGLAGQLPGVQIVQGSGMPGQAPQINVRGIGTLTAGTQPLIVVDGFPVSESINTSTLNPNDIESVEVLKDAAAASIYGSRGANGVVLITTKKGAAGKTKFNFDANYGLQRIAKKLELQDAYEFARFVREGRDNYYVSLNPAINSADDPNPVRAQRYPANRRVQIPDFLAPYLNNEPGLTNTDWQEAIFRDAPIQSYQLSASGGDQHSRFFVSGNYFDQQGIVVGSDYKRYALRVNLETKFSDRITFGLNLAPAYAKQNRVKEGWGDSPITMMINSFPTFSPYAPDGSLALSEQIKAAGPYDMAQAENPVALATRITDQQESGQLLGGAYLTGQLVKGLQAKTYLGGSYLTTRDNYYRPSGVGDYRVPAPTLARGYSATYRVANWLSENTLTYQETFGDGHHLNLLAGYTIQKEEVERNQVEATNFPNDAVPTLSAGQVNGGTSAREAWALISYLGRALYNYKDRYLLTAALRRDGSSRFGANTKWGYFPSVSAGWRMSREAFFPQNRVVSDVKWRASWGITGNNQIPNYGAQALLTDANAVLANAVRNGLAPSTSPNPNISWEETRMVDLGLDLELLQGRIYLSADYYRATTYDLLLNVPVPAHSGYTTSLQNIGQVRNTGWELVATIKQQAGPVALTGSLNFSTNENEVVALGPGQEQLIKGSNITRIGQPIGAHYGYQVLGVFASQEQLDNTPHVSTAEVGSYIYADSNGDGRINDKDRTALGDFWPDYTFGLSASLGYRNFDLSFLLQGVQGVQVRDQTYGILLVNAEGWGNASREIYQGRFVSPENPGSGFAEPRAVPSDILHRTSSLAVNDASFVRFRNITFGYTLPKKWFGGLSSASARFYLSSKNPFTFTRFKSYNPEQTLDDPLVAGSTQGNYPLEKSLTLGVNLTF